MPLSAFTLLGRFPPWASWQSRQRPSATGACFTGLSERLSASWHSKQTFSRGWMMSPAYGDGVRRVAGEAAALPDHGVDRLRLVLARVAAVAELGLGLHERPLRRGARPAAARLGGHRAVAGAAVVLLERAVDDAALRERGVAAGAALRAVLGGGAGRGAGGGGRPRLLHRAGRRRRERHLDPLRPGGRRRERDARGRGQRGGCRPERERGKDDGAARRRGGGRVGFRRVSGSRARRFSRGSRQAWAGAAGSCASEVPRSPLREGQVSLECPLISGGRCPAWLRAFVVVRSAQGHTCRRFAAWPQCGQITQSDAAFHPAVRPTLALLARGTPLAQLAVLACPGGRNPRVAGAVGGGAGGDVAREHDPLWVEVGPQRGAPRREGLALARCFPEDGPLASADSHGRRVFPAAPVPAMMTASPQGHFPG